MARQENKGDYICVVIGPALESKKLRPGQETPKKAWDMETDFLADLDSQNSRERDEKAKIVGEGGSNHKNLTTRSEVD